MRVAILGGAGHIARTLTPCLPATWQLTLFTDHSQTIDRTLVGNVLIRPYDAIAHDRYDIVINAAGPGDPAHHRDLGGAVLDIMARFDAMAMAMIERHPGTAYIHLSSGAIYGADYSRPVGDDTALCIPPNRIEAEHYYALAKIYAEARHRALAPLAIADIRIFGYFTRHIDAASGFFLSQVAACLRAGKLFETSPHDFVRDLISPGDLAQLIVRLAEAGVPHGFYDAVSARPTTKFAILDRLTVELNLEVRVTDEGSPHRLPLPDRISTCTRATQLGYHPSLSSLDLVLREVGALTKQSR